MVAWKSWFYDNNYFARRRKQLEDQQVRELEVWVKAQIEDLDRWVDQRFPSTRRRPGS